jgi:oxygen-independent coproporphyrinogen-3 oxidase
MFAIPTQSMEIWESTLKEILALQPEHMSCYEVIYEEDTPLYHQLQAGEFDVDEDLACEMYDRLVDRVSAAGFRQYEVANFARSGQAGEDDDPDFACRHNINYWRGGEYLGLGPSADEFVNGVRTKNWSNTGMYCEQIERGQRAIGTTDRLDPAARAGETAAFGLRMNRGWRFDEFKRRTGYDLQVDWTEAMDELSVVGWGQRSDTSFRLTREGLRFADAAAERFLRV